MIGFETLLRKSQSSPCFFTLPIPLNNNLDIDDDEVAEPEPLSPPSSDNISEDSFSVFDTILVEDFTLDIDDQIEDCDGPNHVKFDNEANDTETPLRKVQSLPSLYNPNADIPLPLETPPQGISQDSSIVEDTTLLKHVPYYGDGQNLGGNVLDLEVGPVFEVTGVYICHDEDDSWEQFEIYGEIFVMDEHNIKRFCIYKRNSRDPEIMCPDHDFLSLTPDPIAPLMKAKVVFNLTNKTRNTHFKEEKTVEYSITDDCDDEKILRVQGRGGYYVEMLYTINPFAHVVKVSYMLFRGPSKHKMDKFDVVGDIIGNGISILKEQYFEPHRSDEEGEEVCYCVKLSRTVFAIPVYSLFTIEIDMYHEDTELINRAVSSSPYGFRMDDILYFDCKNKNHFFFMSVNWDSPDKYFRLRRQLNEPVISEQYVEVFSVYVGGGNSTLALTGSIIVQDPKSPSVYIFFRKPNCPDKLSSNKDQLFTSTVALAWPDWWVRENDFFMHLMLQDNQGNSVCRGTLAFANRDCYPASFDKRICTVIRGENGHFVAVHYSIFRNGLRATVTVVCEALCNSFDVYGNIYVEYGNHAYSLMYDQNYYRVIIFNRSAEYCAKMENCSELPLSKSKITAPADCGHIVVYVDLTIRPNTAPFSHHYAKGKLKFKTGGMKCSEHVLINHRQSCMGRVTVKIDWSL